MSSDLLEEFGEKFKLVQQLVEKSVEDPETEPYKSRYEAIALLNEMKMKLSGKAPSESAIDEDAGDVVCSEREYLNISIESQIALALIQYHLSLNKAETEEFQDALSSVSESLATLDQIEEDEDAQIKTISLRLSCLNQKAVLKSRNGGTEDYKEACVYLESACNIYKAWRSQHPDLYPKSTDDVLSPDTEASFSKRAFETLHTTSLYLLAQVWKQMDLKQHSTLACYLTLTRLAQSSLEAEKVDWIDWALNSATLSQCFASGEMYTEAKNCLTAAYCALEKGQLQVDPDDDEGEKSHLKEKLDHCRADVDRCCLKYCLNLLQSSWTFEYIPEQDMRNMYKDAVSSIQGLTFCDFDVNKSLINTEYPCFEGVANQFDVTSSQVEIFEQARQVFLIGQSRCNRAKLFYTEDTYCRDYIELVRDHSQLFKQLTYFEYDLSRKISMNKKRTELLSAVLKDLNPEHYIQVCRQLQYELGETFSDIADLQKELCALEKDVSLTSAKKINASLGKAVHFFKEFLKTFENINNKLPDKLPEMYVRPALMAHFYLARLYSKFIVPPTVKAQNVEVSGSFYKYIVDYCQKNEEALEEMKHEYPICSEMVMLTHARKQASLSGSTV